MNRICHCFLTKDSSAKLRAATSHSDLGIRNAFMHNSSKLTHIECARLSHTLIRRHYTTQFTQNLWFTAARLTHGSPLQHCKGRVGAGMWRRTQQREAGMVEWKMMTNDSKHRRLLVFIVFSVYSDAARHVMRRATKNIRVFQGPDVTE